MKPTRMRLERSLSELDIEVSALLQAHPDGTEFWPRFARLADEIMQLGDPADLEWLTGRIGAMLSTHGLAGAYPAL